MSKCLGLAALALAMVTQSVWAGQDASVVHLFGRGPSPLVDLGTVNSSVPKIGRAHV